MSEEVTVVGAGPAGLAVAACLKRRGITALLLEASEQIGAAWRRHYERLHLHTHKGGSALPGLPFPSDTPRYLGYRPALADFLPSAAELCDERGFPRADGEVRPGLHLCGFRPSTRGMLKEIGIQAQRTARAIAP